MTGIALASPRVWQFPAWVAQYAIRSFPRWFSWSRPQPIVRPPRKPIRLNVNQLEGRQSPTTLFSVDPLTVSLVNIGLGRLHEPLPALVQTSPASEFNHAFSASDAGEHVNPARIASRSAAPSEETSNGRAVSYGTGDDGAAASAAPTPMPSHFANSAFAVNLDPIASGQSLVQDPFTLDALLQSKPPSRLSFPPNTPSPLVGEGQGGGAGSGSTGGGGGSSSADSGQGGGASFGGASAQGIPFGSASSQDQGAGGVNPLLAPSAPGFHAAKVPAAIAGRSR